MPRFALVATTPDGLWTAVTRAFEAGESSRCRLCPPGRCRAEDDTCQVLFRGVVLERDALLISSVGIPRMDRGGPGPDHG